MIYVHVPFCRSFCTYCDFYSRIPCRGRDREEFDAWADGIVAEIEMRREEIATLAGVPSPAGEPVAAPILSPATLYFGGGTPSVLPLPVIRRIVEALQDAAVSKTGLPAHGKGFEEFTFEVNPEDIVQAGLPYASGLRELGVNRISMGVQSLDDGILRWMNRRHDAARAAEAFRILREAGFDNISVDIIFGISGLGDGSLRSTLDGILGWGPEHISAYQLTLAEDSALGEMAARGEYSELPDEDCSRQYSLICRCLSEAGYRHYEVSNWALPGREAIHNSAYWSRRPYVGLGPAAHSFRIFPDGTQQRSWNLETGSESETLTPEDIRVETVMLALRTADGMPEGQLRSYCDGDTIDEMLSDRRLERFSEGATDRQPEETPVRIRIPEKQFFVSEAIIRDLL